MRKRTVTTIEIAERVVVFTPRTEDPAPAEAMVTPEEADKSCVLK